MKHFLAALLLAASITPAFSQASTGWGGPVSAGTPNQITVTCGTSSTALLAASAAQTFVTVRVPAGAANAVWFNFAGVPAVTAAPSLDLAAGTSYTFNNTLFLANSAFTCIASAPTAVTILYK